MAKAVKLEELVSAEDPKGKIDVLSFEQGLQLLEELVATVEGGKLALDSSIVSYERGVQLIEHLKSKLSGAEEKLRLLQRQKS